MLAYFAQTTAIIALVFEKNANFFAENCDPRFVTKIARHSSTKKAADKEIKLSRQPGSPDFYRLNIPKQGKYTKSSANCQIVSKMPNVNNIYQMAAIYSK
jgi:hypothetical protein